MLIRMVLGLLLCCCPMWWGLGLGRKHRHEFQGTASWTRRHIVHTLFGLVTPHPHAIRIPSMPTIDHNTACLPCARDRCALQAQRFSVAPPRGLNPWLWRAGAQSWSDVGEEAAA